jgi:hypothetical protein
MAFGSRYHPIWTMIARSASSPAALPCSFGFPVIAVALVLYGAGNGIYSIARGTLPLALFGAANYAVMMGRLAMPSLLAQALAPIVGAQMIERGGPEWALATLAGLACLNVTLVAALWLVMRRTP